MSQPIDPVADIFSKHGRVSKIARELRRPVGTVFEWKKNGAIPDWHRAAVLDAVRRMRLKLATETIAYLADTTPALSEGVTA